jgi:hypothetical protein
MLWFLVSVFLCPNNKLSAQVVLSADGSADTYSLINNVLAPGYNVVETPDCSHEEFGEHIDQIFDGELDCYVFRFHIHVDEDNDRCINYDRQRTEIKTYSNSPDNLKAIKGETVEYKWKFKLDAGFQTSSAFTHLHQIKAVGGEEEGMPLITLTARSDNKLQLRYAEFTSQETIKEAELQPLLGCWVEVTEQITFGETGSYKIDIIRLSDEVSVFSYSNFNIRMWKTNADFLRPKWGVYRSLDKWEDLRDEIIYFNDFSIEELKSTSTDSVKQSSNDLLLYPNPATSYIDVGQDVSNVEIMNVFGQKVLHSIGESIVDVSSLKCGLNIVKMIDKNGYLSYGQFVKR